MARLFRNGLAVSAFAVLEDFLRSRASELFSSVSRSSLAFTELPKALQSLCTEEVVAALRFQVGLRSRNGEDVTVLVRETGRALASTAQSPYELSDLAFGRSRSNIGQADIADLTRAFNVSDGWSNVTAFAQRMGLASLSLLADFRAATARRHKGAHDAGSEIPLGDLQGFPAQALGIAAGFDALMARAAYCFTIGDKKFAAAKASLRHEDIGIRFVEWDGRTARDVAEGKARAAQSGSDLTAVTAGALGRCRRTGSVLVSRRNGVPFAWETTDLGLGRP